MRIPKEICGDKEPCDICMKEHQDQEAEVFGGNVATRTCTKCGKDVCPIHSRQTDPEKYSEGICTECDK